MPPIAPKARAEIVYGRMHGKVEELEEKLAAAEKQVRQAGHEVASWQAKAEANDRAIQERNAWQKLETARICALEAEAHKRQKTFGCTGRANPM